MAEAPPKADRDLRRSVIGALSARGNPTLRRLSRLCGQRSTFVAMQHEPAVIDPFILAGIGRAPFVQLGLAQLVKQRLRFAEIKRIKPLREPFVQPT